MDSSGEAVGVGVSPGIGVGELQVDVDDALDAIDAGRAIVLALESSSPSDVEAMTRAAGIITVVDDPHSHTTVVARAAGVPAVVGVDGMRITANGIEIARTAVGIGSELRVDGDTGTIRWGGV